MTTPLGDFHHPRKLNDNWEENFEKCKKWVSDGVPVKDAVMSIFGITKMQYYNWLKYYESDVEAGFNASESRLIELIDALKKLDGKLHHKLAKNSVELALDGSVDMSKFLLERRYGYKKPSKEIEVGTKEDTSFTFNITQSKPKDD